VDALSEALNAVRMTGGIFTNSVCTSPWGFSVPAMTRMARLLSPGTGCVVSYHLVTEGRATIKFPAAESVSVAAGDIVIIPHGDPYTFTNGVPAELIDSEGAVARWLAGDVTPFRTGGGGETTRFVCGYFGCERHAARLFLAGLPSVIAINVSTGPAGPWLESSIRHLLDEAQSVRPGTAAVLSKMAEALFMESLRRYMEQLPLEAIGWLAGARDQVVGSALALMHRRPSHAWTVSELAAEVGASRSLLGERFQRFLGEPPLSYLARWRLQLAARLLRTTQKTILHVAMDVGYESEAAFKREFGLPPARYRRKLAVDGSGPLRALEANSAGRTTVFHALRQLVAPRRTSATGD